MLHFLACCLLDQSYSPPAFSETENPPSPAQVSGLLETLRASCMRSLQHRVNLIKDLGNHMFCVYLSCYKRQENRATSH